MFVISTHQIPVAAKPNASLFVGYFFAKQMHHCPVDADITKMCFAQTAVPPIVDFQNVGVLPNFRPGSHFFLIICSKLQFVWNSKSIGVGLPQ
jgi:hypothetical protein